MGFPITGQVCILLLYISIYLELDYHSGQNYNLVSMAFYLGFLTFEFPTVYISQKLRLGKYLGEHRRVAPSSGPLTVAQERTSSSGELS
jgi:hypothetical protein